MALFRHRRPESTPSGRGTAQVLAVNRSDGPSGPCVVLRLLVQLPGAAPYQVEHEERGIPAGATPTVGAVLPVVTDPGGGGRVRVLWGTPVTTANPTPGPVVGSPEDAGAQPRTRVFRNVQSEVRVLDPQDPAAMAEFGPLLRMAERMTGVDLDGDGRVYDGPDDAATAGWTVVAPGDASGIMDAVRQSLAGANLNLAGPAPASGGDTVARLERLAALRAAGQLTQEEFEAAKRQVLREP